MNALRILTVAVSLMLSSAAMASTVNNGSFEVDPGAKSQGVNGSGKGATFATMPTSGRSWGIWTSPFPGWSVGENGIELQVERTLGLTPYDGEYYVELDTRRNAEIWQNVFLDPGHYQLSFAFSPRRSNTQTNEVSFGVVGTTLSLDSITGPGNGTSIGAWTLVERRLTVETAGTYRLFFGASGTSDSLGGFVDAVSLQAVPVPAAALLLIGGLGALAALRRRS